MAYTAADHTFVLCAYKESAYLEECLLSLKEQSVRSTILIATSTPNDHIRSLAEKYRIPLFITDEPSGICSD